MLAWVIGRSVKGFEQLLLLNSKKFRILEELSEESEQMANMKNVFGVLSDAFLNSHTALAALTPLLLKIVSMEEIAKYKRALQDTCAGSIFTKTTRQGFNEHFQQLTNNLYQVSSLSVFALRL